MKYYGYSVKFTAQPNKHEELINILLQAATQLEANPDCLHYLISTTAEPNAVWAYETWTSERAHDAALKTEQTTRLLQQAMPLIATVADQMRTELAGGKGLHAPQM